MSRFIIAILPYRHTSYYDDNTGYHTVTTYWKHVTMVKLRDRQAHIQTNTENDRGLQHFQNSSNITGSDDKLVIKHLLTVNNNICCTAKW